MKLKTEFDADTDIYTLFMNELSNEYNADLLARPKFQKDYLQIYNDQISPANLLGGLLPLLLDMVDK
jgi:hypothetical protein